MDTRVDQLWLNAVTSGSAFSILMIDIDNFKKYNDHYGHQSGDDCLRQVARALEAATNASNASKLTSNAFVARYGGEEFAVIVPGAAQDAITALARQLVEAIREIAIPHERNADWGKVTISAGGASIEQPEDKVNVVFRLADSRLYQAKNSGRNCAVTA
jgi:diguanylate cyclase (GGDEF)-like protein